MQGPRSAREVIGARCAIRLSSRGTALAATDSPRVATTPSTMPSLPVDAWRSNVAAAGETTAPSLMEQSVDVGGALLQLVQPGRLEAALVRVEARILGQFGSRGTICQLDRPSP